MCYSMIGQAIGGQVNIYGSYTAVQAALQTGKFNTRMYKSQALQADRRAAWSVRAGQEAAQRLSLESRQTVASGTAAIAANGVLVEATPGSSTSLWQDSQRLQLDLDRQLILDNADTQSWNFRQEAAQARNLARFSKYTARQQATSTMLSGISSAISSGFSMAGSMMSK